MQLSERDRQRLVKELQYVVKQMHENQSNILAQLYFFSAGYGVANRLLNDIWDAELSLIHTVLQATYREIQARLQTSATRGEQIITIPERLMPAIIEATEKLAVAIQDKRDSEIYPILARFSELGYVATGNGYYLFFKGEIKI